MLTLNVPQDGQVEATIPLGWCISPALVTVLKEKNIKKPAVVIVVADSNNFELERRVVPLSQGLEYIQVHNPGEHVIHVSVPRTDYDTAVKCYMKKDRGGYDVRILFSDNRVDFGAYSGSGYIGQVVGAKINVDVDASLFPKKPNVLLWKFVNWFYKSEPVDQCAWRLRLITLPVTMLCVFAFWLFFGTIISLIKLIVISGRTFVGCRGTNYATLLHPLEIENGCIVENSGQQLKHVLQNRRENFYITNSKGWERPWFVRLLAPYLLFVYGSVFFLLWHSKIFSFSKQFVFSPEIIIVFAVLLALAIIIYIIMATKSDVDECEIWRKEQSLKEQKERDAEFQKARRLREIYLPLEAISCTNNSPPPLSVDKLPASSRTVRLRFWGTKVKVCRPYARN